MAWNKKAGKKISKDEATKMIDSFQKEKKDHIRSIYYDKEMLQSLINTPGCAGVSIYFAKNGNEDALVLVPVDENGKAIWDGESALEVGNPCPPYC